MTLRLTLPLILFNFLSFVNIFLKLFLIHLIHSTKISYDLKNIYRKEREKPLAESGNSERDYGVVEITLHTYFILDRIREFSIE